MNHITPDISKKPLYNCHPAYALSHVMSNCWHRRRQILKLGNFRQLGVKKKTKLYVMHMMPSAMTAEHKNVTFTDADRNKAV